MSFGTAANAVSRNRLSIANTATNVPLTEFGAASQTIRGRITRIRFQNESATETIYIQLNGTGAATVSQQDHIVLTPTTGLNHTREFLLLDTGRRTLSAIASAAANLSWEADYLIA